MLDILLDILFGVVIVVCVILIYVLFNMDKYKSNGINKE